MDTIAETPFQRVNDSATEPSVGTHTKNRWINVGIPSIATSRSLSCGVSRLSRPRRVAASAGPAEEASETRSAIVSYLSPVFVLVAYACHSEAAEAGPPATRRASRRHNHSE